MFDELFLEDGDLLELVQLEALLKRNKKIEPKVSRKQAIQKARSVVKDVLKDSKYSNFKKSIKEDNHWYYKQAQELWINGEDDEEAFGFIYRVDGWDAYPKLREDYDEFDKELNSFIKDINEEIKDIGYTLTTDGDWDTFNLILVDGSTVREETDIEESSTFNKIFVLPAKVRKYAKKAGKPVNDISDYIKYGYNAGLREVIKRSKDIDELQYLRADANTLIPTLKTIKERVKLCRELGETTKTEPYYKYIKKHYIDKGITEKDVQNAIDEIHNQNKLISERIKELKK